MPKEICTVPRLRFFLIVALICLLWITYEYYKRVYGHYRPPNYQVINEQRGLNEKILKKLNGIGFMPNKGKTDLAIAVAKKEYESSKKEQFNEKLPTLARETLGRPRDGKSTEIPVVDKVSTSDSKALKNVAKFYGNITYKEIVSNQDTHIWINPEGSFLDRIEEYNSAISNLRKQILDKRQFKPWQAIKEPLDVLWCNRDDFMNTLVNYTQVTTVFLKWSSSSSSNSWSSLRDNKNILVQKYYDWSAMEPLCKWIKTPGYTKARWDAVYNRICTTEMNTAIPMSIEPVYFHGKPINTRDYWPNGGLSYPKYFYSTLPQHVLYMHIIQDAVILNTGDIISGNLKLVPYACSQDTGSKPPSGYDNTPIYGEVLLVSQFWGGAFFHKMVEGFPRLAPYMKFLDDNPSVHIHVVEPGGYTKENIQFIGVNPERLVTGLARAKVLYVPQATPCGFGQIQEMQILNKLYCDNIERQFGKSNITSVVFIKRSAHRRFQDNDAIEQVVSKAAKDFGYTYEVFSDSPTPDMVTSMQMFNRALLIVAPHGAGLSNMLYSHPGTYIIEAVCNEPHVNMCYQWSAHVLGHRYHAIPSRDGCEDHIEVEPALIDLAVRTYLQQIKWKQIADRM